MQKMVNIAILKKRLKMGKKVQELSGKNDQFAKIAANGIGGRQEFLYEPKPVPDNGKRVFLSPGGEARAVKPKMSTPEELAAALSKMRKEYAPFLSDCAPLLPTCEEKTVLSDFSYRLETPDDRADFLSALAGEGNWEKVTIPHYGAPVGRQTAFYRTTFMLPNEPGKRVILSFQGVDYLATVYLNGREIGTHEGFFAPFELDATHAARFGALNTLFVVVENDFIYMGNKTETGEVYCGDKLYAATGIGYDDPALGWHHCPPGMGIYNEVSVSLQPNMYVSDLYVRPLPEEGKAEVWIEVDSASYIPREVEFLLDIYGKNFESHPVSVRFSPVTHQMVGMGDSLTEADLRKKGKLGKEIPLLLKKGKNIFKKEVEIPDFIWWKLDSPYLYEAQATLIFEGAKKSGKAVTFGMRSFYQDTESPKKGMFYLNGAPIRLRGANTMGFEQLDVLRGDTNQLIDDILLAKICHMNFWRLTQRPVQREVYEYCDRLGLLTQTDLPLFGCMRRNKFAEGVRQAEEMEHFVRFSAANILVTYINEPFPNAAGEPHRHMVRSELEDFFTACDKAVHLQNPDRVMKHVDGDYDPPTESMPDNHCYPLWYNGHGIDIGKLYKGYWLSVKPDWFVGCGEFGIEGLDPLSVMTEDYPPEWMETDENGVWSPARIVNAQTAAFHYMFYDTCTTPRAWIQKSQEHQAFGVGLMTEAFRRNPDMVSFAVHLFIDAWPSGWMKTIMDHRRQPKKAYFSYRNALEPILISLRSDRWAYFGGEELSVECFLSNDTESAVEDDVFYELYMGKTLVATQKSHAVCPAADVTRVETVCMKLPEVSGRTACYLRAVFGESYYDFPFTVYPEEAEASGCVTSSVSEAERLAGEGKTVLLENLEEGTYKIGGRTVTVKAAGMLPVHFVSRATNHPWVTDFKEKDFSYWYDKEKDCITPIAAHTFQGNDILPVLTGGNMDENGVWQTEYVMGEWKVGSGRIVLSTLDLSRRLHEPAARKLWNKIMNGGN